MATYTFEVTGGNYLIDLRVYGYGNSDGVWTRIADATAVLTENGDDATLTDGWLDSNNFTEGSFWHWVNAVAGDNGGDPDYGGWRRTRQGYGLSLRLVLPPELVFFFDVAIMPGGDPMFYFGGGESL